MNLLQIGSVMNLHIGRLLWEIELVHNETMPAQLQGQSGGGNSEQGLLDILVSRGVLKPDIAQKVKKVEENSGKPQEEIIKSQNLVSEEDLAKAKATLYNVEYIDLGNAPSSPQALALVSQDIANRFVVYPVSVDSKERILGLAMSDPLDLTAIEFIEQRTGYRVKPLIAASSKIRQRTSISYSTTLAQEVTQALKEVSSDSADFKPPVERGIGVIKQEKIAEIVRHLLEFGVRSRASDIHIEPQEKTTRVRYRIDGILQEKLTIPKDLHEALISRIKILSKLKIDEKRRPQDGSFTFNANNEEIDLRVSTLPTSWGEKAVLRILKKQGGIPSLTDLGLQGRALKNLEEAILKPHGIILICGPTGSGKTTTLYSIIQKISTPKINIVTLEDPVEYKFAGVNQVQINPAAGLTFASGLRSILRQDPNVILVGEIRDQETADLAIQASLTGHLVFSTLHTNNASDALPRLLDMGVEPYLLGSTMTAIVAQRVVRKIHEDCKKEYKPDEKVVNDFKETLGKLWDSVATNGPVKFFKGEGDANCGNSGYFGRIGIFEVLSVTQTISRLILERASAATIEQTAIKEGMITLIQDGYIKVAKGITTVDEVLRVARE